MITSKVSRKSLALVALFAVVIALVPLYNAFAHESGPHLRFAHLSPDSPAVDIYVNNELIVNNLKYKDVTEYLAVEGGDFTFVIVPTGGKIGDSVTEKPIQMTFSVTEGRFFTLAAVGSLKDKTFDLFRFPADRSAEAATPDVDDNATMASTQAK